jgi:hypothetical protein
MDNKFSYSDLATQIRAVPGKPGFERSIEILKLLLNAACSIDDTAPIVRMLEADINKSTPDEKKKIGHTIGINLASGNDNYALVRSFLVLIVCSKNHGINVEFACRQFEYATKLRLKFADELRAGGISYRAVAEGVFYSEAREDSDLGTATERLAASYVSADIRSRGLTSVAKDNLSDVMNLVQAKEKDDMKEYKNIIDKLNAKR